MNVSVRNVDFGTIIVVIVSYVTHSAASASDMAVNLKQLNRLNELSGRKHDRVAKQSADISACVLSVNKIWA